MAHLAEQVTSSILVFTRLARRITSFNSQLSLTGLESNLEILKRQDAERELLSTLTADVHQIQQSQHLLSNLFTNHPLEIRDVIKSTIRSELEGVLYQTNKSYERPKHRQKEIEKASLSRGQGNNNTACYTNEDASKAAMNGFDVREATQPTWQGSTQAMRDYHEDSPRARYHICRKEIRNFLGHFSVKVCRIYEQSNGCVKELVEIQLSLVPDPRWASRALQTCILYDHTIHRQPLCQFKLHVSGVRRSDDPILDVVRYGSLHEFIEAMRDGNYRPDDLYYRNDLGPRSLLNVREISYNSGTYLRERLKELVLGSPIYKSL